MTRNLIFGDLAQQRDFQDRNSRFFDHCDQLDLTFNAAFDRQAELASPADRAVYFLGRLCFEDFMEIICLASNGYGIGAMKLVRGLYERAVVALFLSKHPADADSFWNWRFVSRYKAIHSYVQGGNPGPGWKEKEAEMRARYDLYKGAFEVDDCKACGTKRINHNWSKLDFVSMAKKTGTLGMLLGQAYHSSLNHAHCTSEGLMARLEATGDSINFKHGAQEVDADVAVQLAHTIMISVLECQAEYFQVPGLAAMVEQCANDHIAIWKDRIVPQDPATL